MLPFDPPASGEAAQDIPAPDGAGTPAPHEAEPEGEQPAAQVAVEEEDDLGRVTRERDEFLALAQRAQADFENFRKRKAREAVQAEERAIARAAKELLPALDNLERAISHADADDPLLEGVRLVYGELLAALGRLGIESYSPHGEAFDPAAHEAMAQAHVQDAQSGTVVEVYQAGYRQRDGGTIIRPARVVVAA